MADLFYEENKTDMPDRVWETYSILVGVCNSLNAIHGLYNRKTFQENGRFVGPELCESTSTMLLKAQETITWLLEDSGRLEELKSWESQKGGNSRG